jgi:hypothetical protein
MAIMRAVVMIVHPMIVPAVVIVSSIMVPIAAHEPERVQVAVVIVIGIAVVACGVRVARSGRTSRQGDADTEHQPGSNQKLSAPRDTHDTLAATPIEKSSLNLKWAPTHAARCGDSATLIGLARVVLVSEMDHFRVGFRADPP